MIKNLLQEGFLLKEKGCYKHAIEVFYKALEIDNSSSELLLEIAELYYLIKNEERALSYIEQIIEKDPTHIGALKLLKQIFADRKAYLEAEQTARNIYAISGDINDLVDVFNFLALQKKYEDIVNFQVDDIKAVVLQEQAKASFYLKDYAKSFSLLKKALSENEENQEILLLLGKVAYALNEKEYCVSLLEKLKFDTENFDLLNFIGQVECYRENYASAETCFNHAIRLDRSNSEIYYNLAMVYLKQGKYSQAKKNLNLAISLNPNNQDYHFALANLYYTEKSYKRALEELKGDFFEAKLLKAIILYDTGYLAIARKELSKLSEQNPDNKVLKEYKTKVEKELGII